MSQGPSGRRGPSPPTPACWAIINAAGGSVSARAKVARRRMRDFMGILLLVEKLWRPTRPCTSSVQYTRGFTKGRPRVKPRPHPVAVHSYFLLVLDTGDLL